MRTDTEGFCVTLLGGGQIGVFDSISCQCIATDPDPHCFRPMMVMVA